MRDTPATEPRRARVLLATDGSEDATAAAAWLSQLPLPRDREVMVVTVVHRPRLLRDGNPLVDLHAALVTEARRLADATTAQVMATRAIARVVEGDARDEIIAAARTWGADLVVLGARGLGAIARFVLGSVSLGVAREAPCPVLVCKGKPREIRTIEVAIDGSEHGRRAVRWLRGAVPAPTARVRLVSVVEPAHVPMRTPALLSPAVRAGMAAIEAERQTALDTELAQAAATLKGSVGEVETVVLRGSPASVLVDDVERSAADLIVVGARGLGAMGRLLLGSVSESVLRHATCPVLVVRPTVEGSS